MNEYVGQQLGNYRLLRLLGQGGFADVYLGEHIHLRTQAAIKVLQMRLAEEHAQAFINEARTIAHLVHPNIVRVLDFGVQDCVPFLVMDYAPGGTLRQRMPSGKALPVDGLFPVLTQVASALQYAHNRKLIHRDIKPENILIGVHGEVLLSDFGLALVTQSTSSRSTAAGGDMAGTATYMAPEQVQGNPRAASDQYALAVVAYEWLTGSRPFQGSFLEVATQQVLAPTPSLRAKVPTIPPAIDEVIMRALAKDPQQRYPSVLEFALALGQVCLQEGIISEEVARTGQAIMSLMASAGQSALGNASLITYLPSATNQSAPSYSTSPAISSSPTPTPTPNLTPPAPQLPFMKAPSGQGLLKQAAGTGMDPQESQLTFVKTPSKFPTPNAPSTEQSVQWPTHSDPGTAQTGWPSPHAELTEVVPRPSGQPGMNPQMLNNTQITPQQFASYTQQQQYPTSAAPGMFGSQPFVTPAPVDNNSADVMRALRLATHTNKLLVFISLILVCMLVVGGGTGVWYFTRLHQAAKPPPVVTDRGHKTAVVPPPATTVATVVAGTMVVTPIAGNGAATPTAVSTPTVAATTTPVAAQQPNPYAPAMGTLVFNDPLSSNVQNWDQTSGCAFAGGAYHVVEPVGQAVVCYAKSTNYANFTYEVQMTFARALPTDAGGIEFRGNNTTAASYRIEVFANGTYSILVCSTSTVCGPVAGSAPQPQPAAPFRAGAANTLAVVANGPAITFFMNGQQVGTPVQDATSAQGMIGVFGAAGATGTGIDVAYSNARVWQ
jgi:serine/threonine protein kinase